MKATTPITTCDAATSTPPMGLPALVGSSSITSSTADLPPFSLHSHRNHPQQLLPSPTNSSTSAVQTQTQQNLQKAPPQLINYDSRMPSGYFLYHHQNSNNANISRSESCLSGTSSMGGCGAPIPIREWEAAASSTLPHHHQQDSSQPIDGTVPQHTNTTRGDGFNKRNRRRNSGGCFTTTTAHQSRRRQSNCSADGGTSSNHLLLSDTTPPHHHIIGSATTSRKQHIIQGLMTELDELDDDALLLLHQ